MQVRILYPPPMDPKKIHKKFEEWKKDNPSIFWKCPECGMQTNMDRCETTWKHKDKKIVLRTDNSVV